MDHEAAHCLSQQRRASLWPLYLLFVLSGLSALVYEVMWTRSFSLVFGSTTHAASVVLAAFFFGMGLGNLLGGRLAKGRTGALFAYA
jgi:spermidine synthase